MGSVGEQLPSVGSEHAGDAGVGGGYGSKGGGFPPPGAWLLQLVLMVGIDGTKGNRVGLLLVLESVRVNPLQVKRKLSHREVMHQAQSSKCKLSLFSAR